MATEQNQAVEALRNTLKEREQLRKENKSLRDSSNEPIAIVGMACRYPGGVGDPGQFWAMLSGGVDGITEFPGDRGWDLERLYDPDPEHPGTSYVRDGGFLRGAADFDAEFFGISPREALAMDPQQRLLLESSWEALEDAGIDPGSLLGTMTGVFAGIMHHDYAASMGGIPAELEGFIGTGVSGSVASGRVAYALGLEGPAVTIDTACSSSLVTLHLAAQALRGGECDLALAGGATVLATPVVFTEFSRQRGLAPDGRCKPFAEGADGTGWSEGAGMLVLERLSEAERKGHPVLAVLKGSAVNQDGASNGLTAPNGPSQQRVIRQALANARLEPSDIDAVEAHGTGTTLGDPIEAGALLATYGQERAEGKPLYLGSVKSNIGHTQAAAGAAGVIKTILAMREGLLPKSLHVDRPSSKVDWSAGEIELLEEAAPWPKEEGRLRRAAVSSFGISGTNAHVILEEAPPALESEAEGEGNPLSAIPLALSAKSPEALRAQAERLASHLAETEADPTDVAYSLATTRSAFNERAVAVGDDRTEILAALQSFAREETAANLITAKAGAAHDPVFLFPGQGSQWQGMALELYRESTSFKEHIDACEGALSRYVEWSLTKDVLEAKDEAWMERLDMVQPSLFALMVSLARLWEERGVKPAAVAGHSQGEIAAAHIAAALSLDDAALIVSRRSQAMVKIAGKGGMLSVSLPEAKLAPMLEPYEGRLSIAAINGPSSLVLSGDPEALEELRESCEADGIRAKQIAVDYAAHSSQIDALKEELEEAFAPIEPRQGEIPFHSTVTGEPIDTTSLDPAYWYRNLRETVLFEPVLRSLIEQGQRTFIEIGPHPVLGFGANETTDALGVPDVAILHTLRREEGGAKRFTLSLAQAHAAGAKVKWQAFFKDTGAKRVPLPTYPFQRKRYWLEGKAGAGDLSAAGLSETEHPLLGAAIAAPEGEGLALSGAISLATHPWLADHAVAGTVLLPGTAFLECALYAAERCGAEQVKELTLEAPLAMTEQSTIALRVSVSGPQEAEREILIHSRPLGDPEAQWTRHAQGTLSLAAPQPAEGLEAWPPPGAEPLSAEDLYPRLAEIGFEYGPAFQGLTRVWAMESEIYAEVSLAQEQRQGAEHYSLHPALTDSALHAALLGGLEAQEQEQGLRLPFNWRGVSLSAKGPTEMRVRLSITSAEETAILFADEAGNPIAQVSSLGSREISPAQLAAAGQRAKSGLLEVAWQKATLAPAEQQGESVVHELALPEADDPAQAALTASEETLALIQRWLADEHPPGERLALLTKGAVAVTETESPDPVAASTWGLVRSAQSEHPGSFVLIDSDDSEASQEALNEVLESEEPQVALRDGEALVPRARRLPAPDDTDFPIDPERTVLITGGLSGLGALFATHLAKTHGAKHLLLVSRSGKKAKGAKELVAELAELGAEAEIAACDVSDPEQLQELLAGSSKERPLGAVIHAAGVLSDSTVAQMDKEQLPPVFAPKASAAWNLHELTRDQELSAFVLFSSVAGTLGGPGQANYAAANCFLDALAQKREVEGLPATSIAWGLWEQEGGMTSELSEADLARMRRGGIEPIAEEQGAELFDAALQSRTPTSVAAPMNTARLRSLATAGTLPPLLSSLVRVPAARRTPKGSLAARLASLSSEEQTKTTLELVSAEVAAVLGHDSAAQIDPERAFKEMGFDSLAAVELRNRLVAATGLTLQPTLVFDYPNPASVAEHLREEATAPGAGASLTVRAQASDEPIAIVGMACRYPGGVGDPGQFWAMLSEGKDGVSEFPNDRGWDLERLYDPDPEAPGTSYAKDGGFLAGAADFDAEFFSISPREALAMDPQQRLLLESSWEALEDAGIDPGSLAGSATGVFAGVMYQDYGSRMTKLEESLEGYLAVGLSGSVVSGRVAYALGLEGPAMTVDTACSSSLVTLHLASQALRAGECDLALAGGATVLSSTGLFTEFSRQRNLAPDGRCKPFAEAADGIGGSEGVGMLLVERLSDAKRNGHPVLALLKGSAVNQDGASNGLTAPNGPSQQRVIRQALANARLEPKDIDAVEAHGTGTTLGDPIEAGALLATYGQERPEGRPLRLGSVKSNIGHTQAAAGAAGVIKTVLAMREGLLPKSLHVDRPSSKVDWTAGEIELLADSAPWPKEEGRLRRAAVSSFGISGTNAHVILEEAPEVSEPESEQERKPLPAIPLALSAKSPEALRAQAERLASHLAENPELDPTDVAYSLVATRSAFTERAVAIGEDRTEILTALQSLAGEETAASLITASAKTGRLAHLFTGQGSQRAGMGVELYEAEPIYTEAFDAACEAAGAKLDEALKDVVLGSHPKAKELLANTAYAQPALFATEVALYRLLESKGLEPDLLAGHSVGEISAAHISGVLSLEDAGALIVARGALMGALPKGGAMLAVATTEKEALASIEGKEQEVSLAAINGPEAIVLSGAEKPIAELEAHWKDKGAKTKRLDVSHAFHSPLMEPMLKDFEGTIAKLDFSAPQIPIVSNLSGELLTTEQATDPTYWVSHVREPVRFAEGVAALAAQGATTFLEIGPDPVLSALGPACLPEGQEAAFVPTLRGDRPEPEAIVRSLAAAHAAGAKVKWATFFKDTGAKRVPLPTYPFQRKRYWLEAAPATGDASAIGQEATEHPLLGAAIPSPEGEGLALSGAISLATHPWLADHAIAGTVLLPGTAFLECALCAAERCGAEQVKELTLEAPLAIPEQGAIALRVSVSGPQEAEREIVIHSRPAGDPDAQWTRHASGTLSEGQAQAPEPIEQWPPTDAEPMGTEGLYETIAELGFEYGPAFQGLTSAWSVGGEIYAEVTLGEDQRTEAERYALHPALSDAALHAALLGALRTQGQEQETTLRLPFNWRGVSVQAPGAQVMRVRLSASPEGELSLLFADEAGNPIAQVSSLGSREISPAQLAAAGQRAKSGLLEVAWQKATLAPAEQQGESVVHELALPEADDPAQAALTASEETLALIQRWLADEHPPGERLALLTKGAVAVTETESPDPVAASTWGLVRSAQSEHPGSFVLIDSDDSEASQEALNEVLESEEPQVALRDGEALVPRARRLPAPDDTDFPIDPERTVLITGGLSGLGALFATHLAKTHGAKHLLLVSRSGKKAKGAKELVAELAELGAEAEIAACDVSDPEQLQELLAGSSKERPLGAVIHAAGVLSDSTVAQMDKEQLPPVFAPKASAAWNLHELTRDQELSAFVLFSSVAGTLGGPGQANYAAANCFLDALAQKREVEGLPATSIAWGLWEQEGGMTSELSEADLARMRRGGIEPIAEEQGAELFDAALQSRTPTSVAAPMNTARLRSLATAGTLPPLLSSLVRVPAARRTPKGSLAARLASLSSEEQTKTTLELVSAEVAAVLGHDSAAQIDPERAFKEMGFDSLAAVELRNRLVAATGLTLQPTLVFDYPNPASVAEHLREEATAPGAGASLTVRAQASDEPIAIVGMACRYPGGVGDPGQFWAMLSEGKDGVSEFPNDRGWDLERLYDPDPEAPGTSYAKDGGFLAGAADFDAEFFSISPREALAMDPQQRLLLESSWEALEDAGIDPGSLAGSATGVFAGIMHHDYAAAMGGVPADLEGFVGTGVSGSVASGRVAYALGFEGPAMTVDTACSSSLVTLHLAAQALRGGECDLALAGGATVVATPAVFTEFSRQRGLAPDGRCKPFAEAADGTGWGEGVGMLVLERLSEARRKGHPVLALLKGSAVNQDGASNGLTAPNGPSQQRVIRQALANARLEPKDIDAVEAHGTGTTLGDPIEAGALLATYGQERPEGRPLRLGSVKSNIGHTQAAAGAAGVIKTVLAMREGLLPKSLHVDRPSSHVDWSAGGIELLEGAIPWPSEEGRLRRAAVSSFGISGTNAHVILEEAPEVSVPEVEQERKPLPAIPLALSAKSPEALRAQAERLASHLTENPDLDPTDVAYSLVATRASLAERAVAIGSDSAELGEALAALAKGEPSPQAITASAKTGRLAYLFTGQGSQRVGMGKELYDLDATYKDAFDTACEAAGGGVDEPLKDIILGTHPKAEELLANTAYAQPALFATEVALYRLLESKGLEPELLAGHSVGEITAAHISGVLSLEDAGALIAARGALMGALPKGGAMLAVATTEQEALASIEGKEQEVSLAAINGPEAIVLSGKEKPIAELETHWKDKGAKTKRLDVSHAFHSPLMEPMLAEFEETIAKLDFKAPQIPIVSNLSGELLTEEQATDPAYWVSHVREPVRFAEGVAALAAQGATAFLEIGPDPVLSALGPACLLEGQEAAFVPTLREDRPEAVAIIRSLANAHAAGAKLNWAAFFKDTGAKCVPLPTYPFQRKRYWLEGAPSKGDASAIGQEATEHPLLGAAIELPGGEGLLLTGRISLATQPWLADHAIAGTVLLPGTAFIECALQAGRRLGCEQIAELRIEAPLAIPEGAAVDLRARAGEPDQGGERSVQIFSRPAASESEPGEGAPWTLHASGTLAQESEATPERLEQWPPPGAEPIPAGGLYGSLAELGFEYGPAFQGLTNAYKQGEHLYAEVTLAPEQRTEAALFAIHPALSDAALHTALLAATQAEEEAALRLPFSWQGVSVSAPGAEAMRVRLTAGSEGGISLLFADEAGTPLAQVASMSSKEISPEQLAAARRGQSDLLGITWQKATLAPAEDQGETTMHELALPEGVDPATAALKASEETLALLQKWLAEEHPPGDRFALLTKGAVATTDGEEPDPVAASTWGLVRSLQSEHPGRFALLDTDGSAASKEALSDVLSSAGEPQIAIREGKALAPRLTRLEAGQGERFPIDPERTVLITGAAGPLGKAIATHLQERHGAHHLLLADGAPDPAELKELLAAVPKDKPLGAVIDAAGDPTTAWALHELTKEEDLSAFVLCSSAAGALGSPGQTDNATASCFLDALAQTRAAQGLPATAIAWGPWEQEAEEATEAEEPSRHGVLAELAPAEALAGFDRLLEADHPQALCVRLDRPVLRTLAQVGAVPPLLGDLIRVPARRTDQDGASLAARLQGIEEEAERQALVLELVRSHVAAALGHASVESIAPGQAFAELGFDSLAAVELRNRLVGATGIALQPTLVFDYPNCSSIASHLLEGLSEGESRRAQVELGRLETSLAAISGDDPGKAALGTRLRALAAELEGVAEADGSTAAEALEDASDDELLQFIDEQLPTDAGDGVAGAAQ